jgi:sigma-B regulation protein RsbQ
MMGVLAANREPSRFGALVLLGPSPRYINAGDYVGGFEQADIDGLLAALDANYLGWSAAMAPLIMGVPDVPALGDELTASFCSTDPSVARHFAHVTFLSDNRADLAAVAVRTLILQAKDDIIAPEAVGEYVHSQVVGSSYALIDAFGHCANLSGPDEVAQQIKAFLA